MLSPLLIAAQDSESVDWTTPIALVAAVVLVIVNGFFVLAEFAIVKVRATRIEELVRDRKSTRLNSSH